MRKNVNLSTYLRVKRIFESKKGKIKFSEIRNSLCIDFFSLKLCLQNLLDEGYIKEKDGIYWKHGSKREN